MVGFKLMNRLIFVPQYPTPMRYQEWWYTEFPLQLSEYFEEVIVVGELDKNRAIVKDMKGFSPVVDAIAFELAQMNQFMSMGLREDDTLLVADLSFPGFFSSVLHHRSLENSYAICHGTSKNAFDYFSKTKKSKWKIESSHAGLFKKVFVATHYHKDKLGWKNIEVIPFPFPPFSPPFHFPPCRRTLISVGRDGIQKRNKTLERRLEKKFGFIGRQRFDTWEDYYCYVSESKVMIITAKEETYGYQVVDAILSQCVPVAPNKFSYPELLPRECLYDDYKELEVAVEKVVSGDILVPICLLKKEAGEFYKRIVKEMMS